MNPLRRSVIEINIANALMAVLPLIAKQISVPVPVVIWARCFIGALVLLVYLGLRHTLFVPQNRRDWLKMMVAALFLGLHWIAYFTAIQMSTVAIALIAMYTWPLQSLLMEVLLKKERASWIDGLGVVAVLAGCLLIVPGFDLGNANTVGFLIGCVSAFLFAARSILSRGLVKTYSGEGTMFFQLALNSVFLLPVLYVYPDLAVSARDGVLILVVGGLITTIPHSLYIRSLAHIKASVGGMLISLQMVYSIILAFFILGEVPQLKTVIGGIIIVLTAFVLAKCHQRATPESR